MARPRKRVRTQEDTVQDPTNAPTRESSSTTETAAVARAPRRTLRGKRGSLKDMPSMPVDILLEIFAYLTPRDLLSLARTTKAFRRYLMNKTSTLSWKAARENVEGLPACPSFLSEPAYANLVFFPNCHDCLKGNVQTVFWEFLARYCTTCRPKWVVPHARFPGELMKSYETPKLVNYVFAGSDSISFYKPQIEKLLKSWNELPDEDKPQFMKDHMEHVAAVKEFAMDCTQWMALKRDSRSDELEEVRRERFNEIVDKLRELDWGEELDKMTESCRYYVLKRHPQVRQPRKLTERAWLKMRDDLIELLEREKIARLKKERDDLLKERLMLFASFLSSFHSSSPENRRSLQSPRFFDMALFPEVQAIIELPSDVEVTLDTFEPLSAILPGLIQQWSENVKKELRKIVKPDFEPSPGPSSLQERDPLDLAVSLIKCTFCGRRRHYLQILEHSCVTSFGCLHDLGDPYQNLLRINVNRSPFSTLKLAQIDDDTMSELRKVVTLCGKDPDIVTKQEMDDLDVRITCTECNLPGTKNIMSWSSAFEHYFEAHLHCSTSWELVSAREVEIVKDLEQAHEEKMQQLRLFLPWTCALCYAECLYTIGKDFEGEWIEMVDHLAEKHGIARADIKPHDAFFSMRHVEPLPVFKLIAPELATRSHYVDLLALKRVAVFDGIKAPDSLDDYVLTLLHLHDSYPWDSESDSDYGWPFPDDYSDEDYW